MGLKKFDVPVPDGTLISRLFVASVKCMPLFDNEQREAVEVMEWMCNILADINLHVFQEVWTTKMEFMNAQVEKRPMLMHIASTLFQRDTHSPTLVAIVLRFCISRLEQLGEQEDQLAAISIKWFKTVFIAVTLHPKTNEPILASHLGKLIMDCFPLAAKASKPTHYFHLLRALFRAIGAGGGRFELLYQEVLPLLPEMLECLSRQLQASDGFSRDMIVELCLTVPLRLTHLLPYLSYLMQPLALALCGNAELASQGLRTLELCIDNLTPDFLDPTLNVVLRDLMEALFSHLRPLPSNHHHSHTTIRILGKLGGRNRRLLEKEPVFRYCNHPESAVVRFSFGGMPASMRASPPLAIAAWVIKSGKPVQPYRQYAFSYVETLANLLLNEVSGFLPTFICITHVSRRAYGVGIAKTHSRIAWKRFSTLFINQNSKKVRNYSFATSHATYSVSRYDGHRPEIYLGPCYPLDDILELCSPAFWIPSFMGCPKPIFRKQSRRLRASSNRSLRSWSPWLIQRTTVR